MEKGVTTEEAHGSLRWGGGRAIVCVLIVMVVIKTYTSKFLELPTKKTNFMLF